MADEIKVKLEQELPENLCKMETNAGGEEESLMSSEFDLTKVQNPSSSPNSISEQQRVSVKIEKSDEGEASLNTSTSSEETPSSNLLPLPDFEAMSSSSQKSHKTESKPVIGNVAEVSRVYWKCIYCMRSVFGKSSLKCHAIGCEEIQKREAVRKCQFCPKMSPESKSYLHEVGCRKNPSRLIPKEKNPVYCPKCQTITFRSYDQVRLHLATKCMATLRQFTKKSLDWNVENNPFCCESKQYQNRTTMDEAGTSGTLKPESSSDPSSMSPKKAVVCIYCHRSFKNEMRIKIHAINCEEISKLEPMRRCEFCYSFHPESRSLLHEVRCKQNPNRIKPNSNNENVTCPKCKLTFSNYEKLRYHLGVKCLETLIQLSAKSIYEHHNINPEDAARPLEHVNVVSPSGILVPMEESKGEDSNEASPEEDHIFDPLEPAVNISVDDENEEQHLADEEMTMPKSKMSATGFRMEASCPFCFEEQPDSQSLREHPVYCSVMKTFEPKSTCAHCSLDLPVSLTGLHELVCSQSRWKIPMTRNNLNNVEIHCPSCGKIGKANAMPRHLSLCLETLQTLLKNALKNQVKSKVNLPVYEDFIAKAGLDYWLKAKQH